MNNVVLTIWNRSLELEIHFGGYSGEMAQDQKNTFNLFIEHATSLLNESKEDVEKYCKEQNPDEIGDLPLDNIFKYVKPKMLYIPKRNDEIRRIGVLCAYKYNPEDGLAIVFENEVFKEIGTEQIVI